MQNETQLNSRILSLAVAFWSDQVLKKNNYE